MVSIGTEGGYHKGHHNCPTHARPDPYLGHHRVSIYATHRPSEGSNRSGFQTHTCGTDQEQHQFCWSHCRCAPVPMDEEKNPDQPRGYHLLLVLCSFITPCEQTQRQDQKDTFEAAVRQLCRLIENRTKEGDSTDQKPE